MAYEKCSRSASFNDTVDELNFVKTAAFAFKMNPNLTTYGELTPGSFFAIRWGISDDGVMVIKLDENYVPTNYQHAIGILRKD